MSASIYRAALQLFRGRQFPSVVAACADGLIDTPDNLHLRVLCARALLALRRDEEAQAELRECLRRDPRCALAYRFLGELALRRDELDSATIFFKEALRIDPGDPDVADLLDLVKRLNQPTVAVEKLPAATVTVGCPSLRKPRRANARPPRLASGTASETRGFGQYLVDIGALSAQQLAAALEYQQSAQVRLGTAAVSLGFVSEPKVEWAAIGYHSRRKAR